MSASTNTSRAPFAGTAVLVVDMQRYFLEDRFGAGKDGTDHIVPAINRLNAAVRASGGHVIWIQTDGALDMCADWVSYQNRAGQANWQRRERELGRTGEGYPLHAGLRRQSADLDFVKTRFSAFLKAPVDMAGLLHQREIDRVIVCGTRTDVCCESTVRDAMMLNFDVVIATDAMSADSPEIHDAAIRAMSPRFALAQTVTEIEQEAAAGQTAKVGAKAAAE